MNTRYSRRALSQLASEFEYLQGRNRSVAANVTASIRSTTTRPKEMPLLGKPTDEADVHVIIGPEYLYRVFYRVDVKRPAWFASCTAGRADRLQLSTLGVFRRETFKVESSPRAYCAMGPVAARRVRADPYRLSFRRAIMIVCSR